MSWVISHAISAVKSETPQVRILQLPPTCHPYTCHPVTSRDLVDRCPETLLAFTACFRASFRI